VNSIYAKFDIRLFITYNNIGFTGFYGSGKTYVCFKLLSNLGANIDGTRRKKMQSIILNIPPIILENKPVYNYCTLNSSKNKYNNTNTQFNKQNRNYKTKK